MRNAGTIVILIGSRFAYGKSTGTRSPFPAATVLGLIRVVSMCGMIPLPCVAMECIPMTKKMVNIAGLEIEVVPDEVVIEMGGQSQ
jgi:hypothetical protein